MPQELHDREAPDWNKIHELIKANLDYA